MNKQKKKKIIAPTASLRPPRAPHPTHAATTPHAAGLRPRGDEPDQSDQSTEITVIPQVRRGAPGHTEFTQPTHAGSKQISPRMTNIWPRETAHSPSESGHIKLYSAVLSIPAETTLGAFQSSRTIDGGVYIDRTDEHRISYRAHIYI